MRGRVRFALGAVLIAALAQPRPLDAHKGITSKYTYNGDVHTIFVARCGRCHIEGGVGPMSLVKYEDAFPWAESMREELLSASHAGESARDLKAEDFARAAHRQISARELDIVLDWATGGTPEGDASKTPQPVVLNNAWARPAPDVVVTMPRASELPADTAEKTDEIVLPLQLTAPRRVAEMDVRPGNPAIVRTVTVSLKTKEGQPRVLGTWFPRQTPVPLSLQPPARLEPGAELVLRIHYKKTWKFEGEPMTDQTAIGFYAAD